MDAPLSVPAGDRGPLTIIAGGGPVPLIVAEAAARAGRPVFIVGIAGEADDGIAAWPHETLRWGQFGRLEALLAEHGTREVVLVGNVGSRPDIKDMKLDFGAVRVVARVAALLLRGDNDLLTGLVGLFEERGYRVVGAHEVAPELIAGSGRIGRHAPDREMLRDVKRAMKAARVIGRLDAGQAAVVVNGVVVALEAAEGTDRTIERVAKLREAGRLRWKGRAGVLAKCAKPQQDLRVDMPTIGEKTVRAAADAGLAGIAIEAGRVMIVDRPAVVEIADREGLFIVARERGEGKAAS
ncbi:MAG TPA: UDP-2,3-diacylglucosamine diphosphatase LpxI [Bauldia sp.]|nr:UDP-2,3-diacylglucosamine diphosphatase LpxI [Bauldia sp.]